MQNKLNNTSSERWANEKEAAAHWKLKPSTLRKRRSLLDMKQWKFGQS